MFFQPSPILPQASGLGFAFDHTPWVRQMSRHGSFPWLTGSEGAMIHSGVRRRNAATGRMGGQRRTSWLVGLSGDVEGNVVVGPVVDPKAPGALPETVPTGEAANAVASAAAGGFLAGGVVAALPAAALGLLVGYMIWGGKG